MKSFHFLLQTYFYDYKTKALRIWITKSFQEENDLKFHFLLVFRIFCVLSVPFWIVKKTVFFHKSSCFKFLPDYSALLWVSKKRFQSCPWVKSTHFLEPKMGFCVWAMTLKSDLVISEKMSPDAAISTCKRGCVSVWDASWAQAFVFICAVISFTCQWGWYLHRPHRGVAKFTSLKFAKCQVLGSKMGCDSKAIFSIQKLIF